MLDIVYENVAAILARGDLRELGARTTAAVSCHP
jgi:hypothetical protein